MSFSYSGNRIFKLQRGGGVGGEGSLSSFRPQEGKVSYLRTVPLFVTAQMFCASRDIRVS